MRIKQIIRFNRLFFIANVCFFAVVIAALVFAFPHLFHRRGILEGSRLILRGANGNPNIILQGDDENTVMILNDREGNIRLQFQGGSFPAMIMKNENQEIVGTFFPLKDGGAAVGLGDREGNMATFIRGGTSPMMNFYYQSNEPNLAMGIANELPHLIMVPTKGQGGMLIHGNAPTSLLFIDEQGKIPVSLSRYGLYQQGSEEKEVEGEKDFSFDIEQLLK